MNKFNQKIYILLIANLIMLFALPVLAANSGNGTGYAWSEKLGWIHFSGEGAANVNYGAKFTSDQITGYVWSEKTGWISLNCLNDLSCGVVPYGIISDGVGNLSGYAWSEKAGWINFHGIGAVEYQVESDLDGNFSGYSWSEKAGWISFEDGTASNYGVTGGLGAVCDGCEICDPPVAYWPMDEGSGSTVYDARTGANRGGHTGTIGGNPTWATGDDCKSGSCLYFDGTGDEVEITEDVEL